MPLQRGHLAVLIAAGFLNNILLGGTSIVLLDLETPEAARRR
jgi:hypothetical protein